MGDVVALSGRTETAEPLSEVITLPTVRRRLVSDVIDKAAEFGVADCGLYRLRERIERWSDLSLQRLLRKMDLLDPFPELFELTTDGMHEDRGFSLEPDEVEQMSCEQKLIRLRTLDAYLGYPYRDISQIRREGELEAVIDDLEDELLLPFEPAAADLYELESELELVHMDLRHKRLEHVHDRLDHLIEARHEGRFRPPTSVNYARNGAFTLDAASA